MHSIGRDVESFPALIPLVPLRGAVVYKGARLHTWMLTLNSVTAN